MRFFLFLTFCAASVISAETLIVGECGSYTRPEEALEAVSSGDTILITSGTYEFEESLMLFGTDDVTILGGPDAELVCTSMSDNVLWVMTSDRVVVKGLRMTHTNPAGRESCVGNVIGIDSCDDVTVSDCELCGCGAIGVYTFNCGEITLLDNYIHSNTIWAVQHEGEGLLEQTDLLPGLTMEGNVLVNNGGRTEVEILDSGATAYIFHGIWKGDRLSYILGYTGSDFTFNFHIAPDCSSIVLDIAMEPDDFLDTNMLIHWRHIRCFNEITYEVDEFTEITHIELTH